LETLLGLFQNPLHLIEKRKDKLLDYDHLQYALDHSEDSEKIAQLRDEVLLAKRNYEALNTQLLEELPCFTEAVATMLQHQLTALVQAQYSFYSSVATILPPLLPPESAQCTTPAEIEQQHAEELAAVCKELARLSIVPTSLSYVRTAGGTMVQRKASEGGSPQRTSRPFSARQERTTERTTETVAGKQDGMVKGEGGKMRVGERKRKEEGREDERRDLRGEEGVVEEEEELSGEEEERETMSGEEEEEMSEEEEGGEREELLEDGRDRRISGEEEELDQSGEEWEEEAQEVAEVRKDAGKDAEVFGGVPSIGTKLRVQFDFLGEDPSELSVSVGQYVSLVCPHDRIGCQEWWLVEAQGKQGYVPATYLTQYANEALR
jgi:hypothetical protein